MKVMIATYKDAVCPHFGHAPEFRLVEIDGNRIVNEEVCSNPGHVPGALPKWMKDLGVDVVIAGDMGVMARNLFASLGITVQTCPPMSTNSALEAFMKGELSGSSNSCHHGEEHATGTACNGHHEALEELEGQ